MGNQQGTEAGVAESGAAAGSPVQDQDLALKVLPPGLLVEGRTRFANLLSAF